MGLFDSFDSFDSASDATLQTSFSQEAYWLLMNDQAMRDRALEMVWLSLPRNVQTCLQNCIWGLTEREHKRVRTLILFVSYADTAEILTADHCQQLQCLCDTLLHFTNVRELRVYGSDVAIAMSLHLGRWTEESIDLPADWHRGAL